NLKHFLTQQGLQGQQTGAASQAGAQGATGSQAAGAASSAGAQGATGSQAAGAASQTGALQENDATLRP
ncbi:MAG: hypothetical protein KIG81_10790, partial [Thermoguttaceae bacterium]|nr:hypothetical protein [Thermoguttaceae bacterium]